MRRGPTSSRTPVAGSCTYEELSWGHTYRCNLGPHPDIIKHNLEIVESYVLTTEERVTNLEAENKYLTRAYHSMMGALIAMGLLVLYAVFTFKGIL